MQWLRSLATFAALAVALLTGSVKTADFNGARRGLSSCGQTAGVYEQWVIGFLSASDTRASARETTLGLGWTLMAFGPG